MKAVILAGGKGTRLRNETKEIPKPMILIGEQPIIEHQILLLKEYGFKQIFILTGHLSEVIEDHVRGQNNYDLDIRFIKEKFPLGTSGALKQIENDLADDFLVLYADMMINLDLHQFIKFHEQKKRDGSLVVQPSDHPHDCDLLEVDNDCRIVAFHSKTDNREGIYLENIDNACIYILSPKIFEFIEHGKFSDFGRNIFPRVLQELNLYGYRTAEYIKDIGTPERLFEVRNDHLKGKIKRLNKKYKRKAIFIDRDGVLIEHVHRLHRIEDLKVMDGAGKAILKINNSEYLAIIITNQSVIAKGICSLAEVEGFHKKLDTLLGNERARIDATYYCSHHPEFSSECNCRKPKTGLLERATEEFNIDLANSYFIGDAETDIFCGKKIGCKTIGVRTGFGCQSLEVKPDQMADNIYDAVNLILD